MTAILYCSTSHGVVSPCSNEQLTATVCFDCIKNPFTRKGFSLIIKAEFLHWELLWESQKINEEIKITACLLKTGTNS